MFVHELRKNIARRNRIFVKAEPLAWWVRNFCQGTFSQPACQISPMVRDVVLAGDVPAAKTQIERNTVAGLFLAISRKTAARRAGHHGFDYKARHVPGVGCRVTV